MQLVAARAAAVYRISPTCHILELLIKEYPVQVRISRVRDKGNIVIKKLGSLNDGKMQLKQVWGFEKAAL